MEFWVTQAFNGVSYGALLFLLAGGLSLIFGMMRIVNMTHGSYYLLGGYVGLTVTIGSILTLFVLMQATAKVDWTEVFTAGRSGGGPPGGSGAGQAAR